MMTNAEIAGVFDDIAEMLRLKKDNIFKIRAYQKAARSIRETIEGVEKTSTPPLPRWVAVSAGVTVAADSPVIPGCMCSIVSTPEIV